MKSNRDRLFDSVKRTFSETNSFINVKAFLKKITDEKYLESQAVKKLKAELQKKLSVL